MKVACILTNDFEDSELRVPYDRLKSAGHEVEIAGKTGTAEVTGAPSHSWFVGFAPATGPKRIAIAVIVENGGYGARAAVPLAGDVVTAARSLGIIP